MGIEKFFDFKDDTKHEIHRPDGSINLMEYGMYSLGNFATPFRRGAVIGAVAGAIYSAFSDKNPIWYAFVGASACYVLDMVQYRLRNTGGEIKLMMDKILN